jgi:AcrR family transcriptional regulator
MFDLNAFEKPEGKLSKAEATKARILETALLLFREKGFDNTTMRDIASACDMAVGTAYHHFDSKDSIVAAYYELVQAKHSADVFEFNKSKHTLKARLEHAFNSKLEIVQNDQKLLGVIMRYVGESAHPLSIFGPGTAHLRQAGTNAFRKALEAEPLPEDLRELAPTAFWALHMGMLLYFLHDSSGGVKTKKLVSSALDLALQLLKLTSQPLVQPLLKPVLKKVSGVLREHDLMI